ncbi:MAG: hypothetical protein ACI32C_04845 [Candidatus Enteromonas sp.]
MANSQNTSFSVAFAKQDKELAQFAPTPVPTEPEVGDPRCAFDKDGAMRMDAFTTQISPALFVLMNDAVFKEHVRRKALVNKEERKIIKATGKEGMILVNNLLSLSSFFARAYRDSDFRLNELRPETVMDGVLFLAEIGLQRMEGSL